MYSFKRDPFTYSFLKKKVHLVVRSELEWNFSKLFILDVWETNVTHNPKRAIKECPYYKLFMSYMSPYYMTHIILAIFYGPYTRFFECINTSHLVQLFDFLHSMDYIDQKPTQLLNGLRISYDSVTFKRIFKESLVLWVFYFTLEFILGILIHI